MRIAQVSTLATPVCQIASGSVESLVWLLSRELTALGHEVTIFGAAGSQPPPRCELVATLPGAYGQSGAPGDWHVCEWINLCRAAAESDRFDVVHCHAYLWALPLLPLWRCALVNTLHVRAVPEYLKLWAQFPGAIVTGISEAQTCDVAPHKVAAIIPHAIDATQFTFRDTPDDYVAYLGRFMAEKGPLDAIAAAKAAGLRLRMAGPWSPYFQAAIEPHVDGKSIEYVGHLTGCVRDKFLGGARALLYPVRQAEPFGLVMAEAMMCGTPVVALRIGAVPEIVDAGVTGCIVSSMDDFPKQIASSFQLDRARVRETAMKKFDAGRMARRYEEVYQQAIASRSSGRSAPP